MQAQQYASGGSNNYQKAFCTVLILVFATNVFVLFYFLLHKGLVTDFSEPLNLFSLAINSPPSQEMRGACGAGPWGDQFTSRWWIASEADHLYMKSVDRGEPVQESDNLSSLELEIYKSPISLMYAKFSSRKSVL